MVHRSRQSSVGFETAAPRRSMKPSYSILAARGNGDRLRKRPADCRLHRPARLIREAVQNANDGKLCRLLGPPIEHC